MEHHENLLCFPVTLYLCRLVPVRLGRRDLLHDLRGHPWSQAERLKRVIEDKKGEGTGPGLSYGRCIDGATGRMVVLERRRRAGAALD